MVLLIEFLLNVQWQTFLLIRAESIWQIINHARVGLGVRRGKFLINGCPIGSVRAGAGNLAQLPSIDLSKDFLQSIIYRADNVRFLQTNRQVVLRYLWRLMANLSALPNRQALKVWIQPPGGEIEPQIFLTTDWSLKHLGRPKDTSLSRVLLAGGETKQFISKPRLRSKWGHDFTCILFWTYSILERLHLEMYI